MKTLWQLLMKKRHRELKEIIRMIIIRSNTEKNNLIQEGKKIDVDKDIKYNETIDKSLKYQS